MNLQRAKAIGKLVVLFGTPLVVVFGLFSCGVYVGAGHRHTITSFEHEWLGLDVVVAPAEKKDDDKKDAKDADTKDEDEKDADKKDEPTPVTPVVNTPPPVAQPPVAQPPVAQPPVAQPPPQVVQPAAVVAAPADPVVGELAKRLETPVTVQLKVLVDDELVEQEPAWVDYVQRTVSRASAIYKQQFGIELKLASVGRWGVATDGMSSDELARDLEQRPRESAQVLIGLTNRPFDVQTSGLALVPADGAPFNGAVAVVYATPRHREAHLRTMLHEVAHLFGAKDITDPANPDYASGSWMSYAPVPETQAPWLDPKNRERVLMRKDKPFNPQVAAPQPPLDDGAGQ